MDDSEEFNHLVRNVEDGSEAADPAITVTLDYWLTTLVERGGSDLLLVEGAPPCIRVQGDVKKIEDNLLDGADIESAILPALSPHALRQYRENPSPMLRIVSKTLGDSESTCTANAAAPLRQSAHCPHASPALQSCISHRPSKNSLIWRAVWF